MILETIQISQNATLTAILHGPSEEMQSDTALRRPAVVICPGGAYEFCSVREADAASRAVHAWVGLCQTWLSARFGPLGGDAE